MQLEEWGVYVGLGSLVPGLRRMMGDLDTSNVLG